MANQKKQTIPKKIQKLLDLRMTLAEELNSVCCEVDAYCASIGITDCEGACLNTEVQIYLDPGSAKSVTEAAILRALAGIRRDSQYQKKTRERE